MDLQHKYIMMLQKGGPYKDLISRDLRNLLSFLEDISYIALVRILTGSSCSTTAEAQKALIESNIPESYFEIASDGLYKDNLTFRMFIDSLVKCEAMRDDVVKQF